MWLLVQCRYIPSHGPLSIFRLTTWECGTWDLNFGHANTLANSFICAFTQHQPQSEMNILFQRMLCFVAEQVADTLDPFELPNPFNQYQKQFTFLLLIFVFISFRNSWYDLSQKWPQLEVTLILSQKKKETIFYFYCLYCIWMFAFSSWQV